jgi:hypothetical protein
MNSGDNTSAALASIVATRPSRRLYRRLFGLSLEEASFARRGFHEGDTPARLRLEHIGRTFLTGYHLALEVDRLEELGLRLNALEAEFRGFAFEGAAMALALLDILTPWKRNRWHEFAAGPASPHIYMVQVGYGWALARLRRPVRRHLSKLDPLLGWLAIDGYGFHQGYFHPRQYVVERATPGELSGYALNVFDQGLGRSVWFVEGADISRIPHTIAAFPAPRQADLWSGVGLACAYAGGVSGPDIEALRASAGEYSLHMAQGAAFAAKARQRAGNPSPHTELACQVLCGTGADEAAEWTDAALSDLEQFSSKTGSTGGTGDAPPSYEVWRQRVRARAAKEVQIAWTR